MSYSLSPSKLNVLLIDMLNTCGLIVWSLYRDDTTVFLVKKNDLWWIKKCYFKARPQKKRFDKKAID